MTTTSPGESQIIIARRMSLMDFCPWAMWLMVLLSAILLPCAGVLYELGAYIGRFRWIEEGVVDPGGARHWEVYLSTAYYFVAFAAAASSFFIVLGLVVTALHRLVGRSKAAEAK